MKLTLLLFARARELVGQPAVELEVTDRVTIGELRGILADVFPQLGPLSGSLLWAVNNDYADDGRQLQPADTVACFPPVSGG